MEKLAFTIKETAEALGISAGKIRGLITEGALKARYVGRRVLILRTDLDEYIQSCPLVVSLSLDSQQSKRAVVRKAVVFGADLLTLLDKEISMRTFNCLTKAGVTSLERLSRLTARELLSIKGLGPTCCSELHDVFEKRGWKWQQDPDNHYYSPPLASLNIVETNSGDN